MCNFNESLGCCRVYSGSAVSGQEKPWREQKLTQHLFWNVCCTNQNPSQVLYIIYTLWDPFGNKEVFYIGQQMMLWRCGMCYQEPHIGFLLWSCQHYCCWILKTKLKEFCLAQHKTTEKSKKQVQAFCCKPAGLQRRRNETFSHNTTSGVLSQNQDVHALHTSKGQVIPTCTSGFKTFSHNTTSGVLSQNQAMHALLTSTGQVVTICASGVKLAMVKNQSFPKWSLKRRSLQVHCCW